MSTVKRVYTFGNKQAEGNGKMRELLGGKGANLAGDEPRGNPRPPPDSPSPPKYVRNITRRDATPWSK